MAIILEGSDNSNVMWGKIGPYLVYRSKQGKMYLRNHITPFNPKTTAQLNHREAWKESSIRWKTYEKSNNRKYWINIARSKGFSTEINAFQSSIIVTYREKLALLGDHTQAINFIKDTNNQITYKESLYRKNRIKSNKVKINAVLKYQKTTEYKTKLKASIEYLKAKGWLTKTKYGMIPYIDASVERDLIIKQIVPPNGGYGSSAFGTGTFGTQRII